jgi:hypothetical protein
LLSPLTRNPVTKTDRAVTRFRSNSEIFGGRILLAVQHVMANIAPRNGGVTSFLLRTLFFLRCGGARCEFLDMSRDAEPRGCAFSQYLARGSAGEQSRWCALRQRMVGTLRACRFPVRATDLKWMISHAHFQTSRTGRAREKLRDFLRFSVTLCSNGQSRALGSCVACFGRFLGFLDLIGTRGPTAGDCRLQIGWTRFGAAPRKHGT